jgi:tetratricopeptide (TPR) repeat protein
VDEALARLEPLVRSHPSCARAHLHLARAWRLRGRVAEAAAAHAAAAEIDPALSGPAAAGLADLVRDHPDRPEPHLARARLLEAEGAAGPAAEALAAAAIRGAGAAEVLDPLRRLAAMEGPQQGRALLALAAAARTLGGPAEAARACLEAARAAPGQIAEARREVGLLASAFPRSAEALAARARIALAGLDLDAALEDAGRLLEEDRAGHGEAARLAEAIAEAGGDARRCAWLRSRALAAGGAFDEAARTLAAWAPRCDGDLGVRMRLLAARVERRRGDREAARRLLAEAESAAPDRGAFLAALHEETVAAARAAARRDGTPSETWRALRAALDLGDADRAEALAGRLGLAARGPGGSGAAGTAARLDEAAAEALARIELLRGRPGRAAALLAEAPPSSLKAHALKLAGRLVEAAAVLAAGEVPAGSPFPAVRDIYRRLAAEEMLGEPGCLLAETSLCFASADPPPEAAAPPPDLPLEGTQP